MKHHKDRLETFTLLVIHNTLKQVREPFGAWRGWEAAGWDGCSQLWPLLLYSVGSVLRPSS